MGWGASKKSAGSIINFFGKNYVVNELKSDSFDEHFDELFEQAIERINSDYEYSKNQEITETEENIPYDTSSFVFGSSD